MSFLKDNLGKILGIIGIGAGVGAIAKISYNKGRKDFAKQTDEKFTEIYNDILVKENEKLSKELSKKSNSK